MAILSASVVRVISIPTTPTICPFFSTVLAKVTKLVPVPASSYGGDITTLPLFSIAYLYQGLVVAS